MKRSITFSDFLTHLTVLLISVSIISCSYDKEELLYPDLFACDTAAIVKYSATVLPIMQASCYECHSGSFPSGIIRLDSYESIRAQAVNGSLYGSIAHIGYYQPMPRDAPKLSDCKITAIRKWIDAGAPNN